METQTFFAFPPVRLDVGSEQLWCDEQTIALRPKTFAVLRYLVEHSGQLVTKDALLDTLGRPLLSFRHLYQHPFA